HAAAVPDEPFPALAGRLVPALFVRQAQGGDRREVEGFLGCDAERGGAALDLVEDLALEGAPALWRERPLEDRPEHLPEPGRHRAAEDLGVGRVYVSH